MGPLSGLLALGMVALCCRGVRGPMLRRMVLQHGRRYRPCAIAPQGLILVAPSLGAVAQSWEGGCSSCLLCAGCRQGGRGLRRMPQGASPPIVGRGGIRR